MTVDWYGFFKPIIYNGFHTKLNLWVSFPILKVPQTNQTSIKGIIPIFYFQTFQPNPLSNTPLNYLFGQSKNKTLGESGKYPNT